MKGFYQRRSDGQMADMPPCGLCLHKNKATYQSPCYNCIDIVDLCLHRPNAETEFVDVSRLGDFKGHLTDREMAQVDVALMASLDLHPIPRQAKVRPVVPDVDDAALALIALRFLEGFLQKRCGVTVQDRLSIDLLGQKND